MKERIPYFELNVVSMQNYNPSPHSPTYKTFQYIRPNTKVLDIGCASGHMARQLHKKNCQVIGIEIDHDAAVEAKKYCRDVIEQELGMFQSLPFPQGSFDYIICLDVLEHLARPDLLLPKLRPYLSTTGELIVSLPNIARFEHRFSHLFGRFNYSDSGALSKGHLRFFTRKTGTYLIESSGYKIKSVDSTGLGSMVKIFPNLLAFQFLFVATKT